MGKIKSKLVRRTARALSERGVEFKEDFGKNKRILGNNLPSKKIRNQLAGLLVRSKKQERIKKEYMLKTK